VSLQKKILTLKFSYTWFFPTPRIKLKLGLQIGDTTNTNPLRPIEVSSQSTAGVSLCCAFLPASANGARMLLLSFQSTTTGVSQALLCL
jgi:hypothetical protein